MFRRVSLMISAALVLGACGGDSDARVAVTATDPPPTVADSEPPEPDVDDPLSVQLGAFAVDLDGARVTPEILADYGDLNVHQIAADDSNVWVTVGDSANSGAAYVARYGLDGVEVGRVNDDGRPLGIEADPLGRGAWFGDAFNDELHFYETSSDSIAATIENVVSSLSPLVLNADGSIWSIASGDQLARIDPESGEAEKIQLPDQNSPTDALLIGDILWQSDALADAVTSFNFATKATDTFAIPFANALLELGDGAILVSGQQLHIIDANTGDVTDLGSVVYPDRSEFFPARFNTFLRIDTGILAFDANHGRLVRLDLDALTADVIDVIPTSIVGLGDLVQTGDGAIWMVVVGEEIEGDSTDHLRRYDLG